jgi:hypothetical protein
LKRMNATPYYIILRNVSQVFVSVSKDMGLLLNKYKKDDASACKCHPVLIPFYT